MITVIEWMEKGGMLWLIINQMSELFGRDKLVVSKHLKSIYEKGELSREVIVVKYVTVQIEDEDKVNRGFGGIK